MQGAGGTVEGVSPACVSCAETARTRHEWAKGIVKLKTLVLSQEHRRRTRSGHGRMLTGRGRMRSGCGRTGSVLLRMQNGEGWKPGDWLGVQGTEVTVVAADNGR